MTDKTDADNSAFLRFIHTFLSFRVHPFFIYLIVFTIIFSALYKLYGNHREHHGPFGPIGSRPVPSKPLKDICNSRNIALPLSEADFVVDKNKKTISLFNKGILLKKYPVAFGVEQYSPKRLRGDYKTPEGDYYLIRHISPSFGRCFYIAYPNKKDAKTGLNHKIISKAQYNEIVLRIEARQYPPMDTRLGSHILLHGTRNRKEGNLTSSNWTSGCIAMENAHIVELLDSIGKDVKPTIKILPYRSVPKARDSILHRKHKTKRTNVK